MDASEIQAMAAEMTRRGLTIATAEADTAGYMGHLLCAPSGASRYFLGGVIAYAGGRQEPSIGRGPRHLSRAGRGESGDGPGHGPAGQSAVRRGPRSLGDGGGGPPTGGSLEKPPGTFWVALSVDGGAETAVEHRWDSADRMANKERAAHAALRLVAEHLGLSPL